MTNAELAFTYRQKYGVEMPTLKLARIMYNENKLRFVNVERCRTVLRALENKSGGYRVSDKYKIEVPERPKNPYNLPASDETIYEPYIIKGHKRVGILSDIHVPYHSIDALTLGIKYLKDIKIDALLLNGDTIDCHTLSRFIKDPKKRNFALELDTFRQLFEVLQRELSCQIYFKSGNHEIRYEHFLQQKAGELIGVQEFQFENIIKARANGIVMIADKQVMRLNSLNGIHGHEYIGGIAPPVNVARGLYLKGKVSAFQGHNHATSSHTERDMNGKLTTTYSIGCLSELHPAYMPLNKWNWGFADVELDPNGENYEFHNHTIYKGKVY
jgi:predicted phosphodiesterase